MYLIFQEKDPVNIQAAGLMGKLHDQLKLNGSDEHELEVYLVRLLFIMFADDTDIFNKKRIFEDYVEVKTKVDGSNLGSMLAEFFEVLNTPLEKQLKNIDEHLNKFPYINGKFFNYYIS